MSEQALGGQQAKSPAPASGSRSAHAGVATWLGPLLIGVFPVLLLYAANARELTLGHLASPLLAAALGAPLLYLVLATLLGDRLLGSLAASLFLALFHVTTPVVEVITSSLDVRLRYRVVLPVVMLLWAGAVLLLHRRTREATRSGLVKSFAVIAVVLTAYNALALVRAELGKAAGRRGPAPASGPTRPGSTAQTTPDIFIIVMDEYAGFSTIKEQWGHDNEPFAAFLEDQGFYVAREAATRYCETIFSVTSLLNLDYVGGPISRQCFYELLRDVRVNAEYVNVEDVFPRLNDSLLVEKLRARGYTIVTIDDTKNLNPDYPGYVKGDIEIKYVGPAKLSGANLFLMFTAKQTLLMPLAYYLEEHVLEVDSRQRAMVLNSLARLGETTAIPGPKLVYAHLLCPHAPFVFGADGSRTPYAANTDWRTRKWYLGQHSFMTSQMRELIPRLIEREGSDVIVLLMSDHGPRPFTSPRAEQNLRIGQEYPVEDMFRVLHAIHAPRIPREELRPTIAPVNGIRLVANHYFGYELPQLPDE